MTPWGEVRQPPGLCNTGNDLKNHRNPARVQRCPLAGPMRAGHVPKRPRVLGHHSLERMLGLCGEENTSSKIKHHSSNSTCKSSTSFHINNHKSIMCHIVPYCAIGNTHDIVTCHLAKCSNFAQRLLAPRARKACEAWWWHQSWGYYEKGTKQVMVGEKSVIRDHTPWFWYCLFLSVSNHCSI